MLHCVIEILDAEQKSAFTPRDLIDPGLQHYGGRIYSVYKLVRRLGLSRRWSMGFTVEGAEWFEIGQSISLREKKNILAALLRRGLSTMAQNEKETGSPANPPLGDHRLVKSFILEDDQVVKILDFERLFYAR